MRVLYLGQYNFGSTSAMRAGTLKNILDPKEFSVIDTMVPFQKIGRLFRSLGFRYHRGPLITNVNKYIINQLHSAYDIIWVDKATFLTPETTEILRKSTPIMVHYTPDCALFGNRSHLFEKSMHLYDWLITTKSFERDYYPEDKLICVTQAYDKNTHQPAIEFNQKTREVSFIGLYEKSRAEVMDVLIEAGIKLTLGGMKWNKYRNLHHPNVEYLGEKVFGSEYVTIISSSLFSLGLLSKKFPELHTTRTFEIPACGTALITERNAETASFFTDNEVIFYQDIKEIPEKILPFMNHQNDLQTLTQRGYEKVVNGGYDYESILRKVLTRILPERLES